MVQGIAVQTDKEGWVQGASSAPDTPLGPALEEGRHAVAAAQRYLSDLFNQVRKGELTAEETRDRLKVAQLAERNTTAVARLQGAVNGTSRELRAVARELKLTPEEERVWRDVVVREQYGIRQLPVPKGSR